MVSLGSYIDEHTRSDHNEMLSVVWDLIQRYNVTKVLVDASAPSFIRALKLEWGERSDYENVEKELEEYMRVEPVSFGVEHKALLYHAKFMLENKYVQIHPTMDKLIIALRVIVGQGRSIYWIAMLSVPLVAIDVFVA